MAHVFSRLLLATEHTEFDVGAEALAFALARRCQMPLAGVLPIVSNSEYEALAPQIVAAAEAQAARRIEALQAQAQAVGISLDLQARRGEEPFQEIVDAAVEGAADLLVIRRRGKRSFLARLMVGEMVAKVVAHAPCSVLIVPRAAPMWSQRVLAAVDPRAVDLRIVAQAAAIAAECALPLSLVAVADGPSAEAKALAEQALQAARGAAQGVGLQPDLLLRSGRAHEQILAAAAECAADLVVVGRHGESRLLRAWLGGVTQKVVGLADRPVLVAVFSS
ncbi:MAG: universal stress protein [Burkholderiaceae bacterium]|nr:universal stress protein [Burkholderiaceae bacterium]